MSLSKPSPASLLSKLVICGHPWHGKVESGSLGLPNSATMAYRQPTGALHAAGMTRLVAVPGAPAVERDAQQQTEDAAAGRQWWNVAMLSGGDAQLYGKSILAGAWIYCDPNGVRWRVTTALQGVSAASVAGTNAAITFRKFGAFGADNETYLYSAAVPADLGQGDEDLGSFTLQLTASHPAGASALFALNFDFGIAQPHQKAAPIRAVGWLKVSVSGAGQSASVAVTVERTRNQVLGSIVFDDPSPFSSKILYVPAETVVTGDWQVYPTCSGRKTSTTTMSSDYDTTGGPIFEGGLHVTVGSGTRTREYTGLILDLWYKPDGTIAQTTLRAQSVAIYDVPELTETSTSMILHEDYSGPSGGVCVITPTLQQEGVFTVSRVTTASVTEVWEIYSDGALAASISYANTDTLTQQYTQTMISPGNRSHAWDKSSLHSYSPGGSSGGADSGTGMPIVTFFTSPNPTETITIDAAARLAVIGMSVTSGWVWSGSQSGRVAMSLARHAPGVWSFCELRNSDSSNEIWIATYKANTATPAGAHTMAEIVQSDTTRTGYSYVHGSWCPVSDQVVRSFNPICWV